MTVTLSKISTPIKKQNIEVEEVKNKSLSHWKWAKAENSVPKTKSPEWETGNFENTLLSQLVDLNETSKQLLDNDYETEALE